MSDLLETRARLVLDEVRAGRLRPDREAVARFIEKSFSLPAAERRRITDTVLERVPHPERKEEPRMAGPKNVLRAPELVVAAAKLFKAEPGLTAREVYDRIAKEHRIGMSASSFCNGYAGQARKIARGEAAPPKAGAAPTATPKKSAPAEKSEGAKKKSPGATKRPPAPAPPPPAPTSDERDHIDILLNGQRLVARPNGAGVHVLFEGTLPDMEDVGERGLVRHVLGGIGA